MSHQTLQIVLLAPPLIVLLAWIHWSIFGWGAGPPGRRQDRNQR